MLQTLSESHGSGTLKAECPVRPISRREAATAEVAVDLTLRTRNWKKDWIVRIANVFPFPTSESRKKPRDFLRLDRLTSDTGEQMVDQQ